MNNIIPENRIENTLRIVRQILNVELLLPGNTDKLLKTRLYNERPSMLQEQREIEEIDYRNRLLMRFPKTIKSRRKVR